MTSLLEAKQLHHSCRKILATEPLDGEAWHPDYEESDPEGFNAMVEGTMITFDKVLLAFNQQAEHLDKIVNWKQYNKLLDAKLEGASPTLIEKKAIDATAQYLFLALIEGVTPSIVHGAIRAQMDMAVNIGWNVTDPAPQKFIREYNFNLVKGLNKTTENRLREALLTGIQKGLNQTQMTDQLQTIFVNRSRAATIANTEVIRAYSKGRIQSLKMIGIPYVKIWLDAQPDSCEICQDLHNQESIKSGLNAGYFHSRVTNKYYEVPPDPHPHCRCGWNVRKA